MNRYPRRPAAIILLISAFLGVAYVAAWGRIERYWKGTDGGQSVEAMEKRIADEKQKGVVSPATWRTYGDVLAAAKEFGKAAAAYKEVLEIEPANRAVKYQRGLALAQANAPELFYQFQKDLVYSEAKLAVEIFERAEAQKYLSEERFSALAKEAKSQAMD